MNMLQSYFHTAPLPHYVTILTVFGGMFGTFPLPVSTTGTLCQLTRLCHMKDQLRRGCAKMVSNVRGPNKCSLFCNLESDCVGFSVDNEEPCFLHQDCSDLTDFCFEPSPNYRHYNKECHNNGRWLESEKRCECPTPMIGDRCQRYYRSCKDLYITGQILGEIGNVTMDPYGNGNSLYRAKCQTDPNHIVYQVFRSQGIESFNGTWDEYRNGFEVDAENYWIGFENVRRLFNIEKECTLLGNLKFGSPAKSEVYRNWYNAKLSDEKNGYRFSYSRTENHGKGDFVGIEYGDCLAISSQFSTWDRDNDAVQDRNCAAEVGSGWWFSDCKAICNIFGYYPYPATHPENQLLRIDGVTSDVYRKYKEDWAHNNMNIQCE